jgi:hypothetical protein
MNRVMISIVLGSSAALGASAFANDTSSTHQTPKEMMQHCMQQQKAQNSGATDQDIQKTCKDQVKAQIAQQQQSQSASPSSQSSYPSPSSTPGSQAPPPR